MYQSTRDDTCHIGMYVLSVSLETNVAFSPKQATRKLSERSGKSFLLHHNSGKVFDKLTPRHFLATNLSTRHNIYEVRPKSSWTGFKMLKRNHVDFGINYICKGRGGGNGTTGHFGNISWRQSTGVIGKCVFKWRNKISIRYMFGLKFAPRVLLVLNNFRCSLYVQDMYNIEFRWLLSLNIAKTQSNVSMKYIYTKYASKVIISTIVNSSY